MMSAADDIAAIKQKLRKRGRHHRRRTLPNIREFMLATLSEEAAPSKAEVCVCVMCVCVCVCVYVCVYVYVCVCVCVCMCVIGFFIE